MALFLVRFTVDDVPRFERLFDEHSVLRASYGCTNARLLVDSTDRRALLALLDFPSIEQAKAYLLVSSLSMGGATLAEVGERLVGFYDELAVSNGAKSPPSNGT